MRRSSAWPAIARGESTLILAPTGSGKTLDGVPLVPRPADVRARAAESGRAAACSTSRRSRRWPSTSSATCARRSPASRTSPQRAATRFAMPEIAIRTGDTPPAERARFSASRPDILITTPESLYLLLTSNARESAARRRHGDHRRDPRARADQARRAPRALARAARRRCAETPPLQRIGLSATQRPLDEVARFLALPRRSRSRPRRRRRRAAPTRFAAARLGCTSVRSPSSTPARRSARPDASKCRSRTWRRSARRVETPERAGRARADARRRSGRRSIRGCSS